MEFKIEQFLKDMRNHKLTILKDDGIYRHIRLAGPHTSTHFFEIMTFPNYLTYVGDMGSYTFSRVEDMFRFFRMDSNGLNPNYGYWAEKCIAESVFGGGIREFSIERFKECVIADTLEYLERGDISELNEEELSEISHLLDAEDEWEAITEIREHDSEIIPLTDFFENRLTKGTYYYQWCCCAIQWAIEEYDKAKEQEETHGN